MPRKLDQKVCGSGERMFKTENSEINLAETFWLDRCQSVAEDEKLIVEILTDDCQSMICSVSFEVEKQNNSEQMQILSNLFNNAVALCLK